MKYRIYLVEDHPLVRESIRHYLELYPDLEVCGTASRGDEALDYLESLRTRRNATCAADLALLDVGLPGMNGIEVVRTLRDRGVTLPVLMLSAHDARQYEHWALKAGAEGYVMKDDIETVVHRIRELLGGELLGEDMVA